LTLQVQMFMFQRYLFRVEGERVPCGIEEKCYIRCTMTKVKVLSRAQNGCRSS